MSPLAPVLAIVLALGLVACDGGGGDDDNVSYRYTSVQSDGSGTGGTIIDVRNLEVVEDPVPLRFRFFPDVVISEPLWTPEPDLDGDGVPDRAWIEDGALLIALSDDGPILALPIADGAVEVRALVTDALADLVVLRADGRIDLYVNET